MIYNYKFTTDNGASRHSSLASSFQNEHYICVRIRNTIKETSVDSLMEHNLFTAAKLDDQRKQTSMGYVITEDGKHNSLCGPERGWKFASVTGLGKADIAVLNFFLAF
ncbi:hypothetical protein MKW98_022282 [Papaver atlanticum]|uniref:Uncharacterized protein n=1 Tax=Papaver atlanticum TaxID=357466 RepID=A0AAD4T6J7_9MAGN|nr:hypothetical protein MKW98_022282 [Papaver atlanticum]